jgi:hypothetical protein
MGDQGEAARQEGPRDASALHTHVIALSPTVFVTLLSILVALDLSDLVTEARARMHLWPLDFLAVRTWGQLTSTATAALSVWLVLAHLGVTRRRVPRLSDSLCTFGPPLLILIANTFVGRPQIWLWLYGSGIYLMTCTVAVVTMVHHLAAPGSGRPFAALLRPLGPFWILYFGAPPYLAAGWLDQHGWLAQPLELVFAYAGGPASLIVVLLFLREWRATLETFASGA